MTNSRKPEAAAAVLVVILAASSPFTVTDVNHAGPFLAATARQTVKSAGQSDEKQQQQPSQNEDQPARQRAQQTQAPSRIPPRGANAVDISRTAGLVTDEVWQTMKREGVQLVIVQAYGGVTKNPIAEAQLLGAQANGLATAAYLIVNYASDDAGDAQAQQALEAVGAALGSLKFLAVDVERCCGAKYPTDPDSVQLRLQRIRDAYRTLSVARASEARPHPLTLIYTSLARWQLVAGNSTEFAERHVPLWDSPGGHFDAPDGYTHCGDGIPRLNDFESYPPAVGRHRGWTKRVAKQYDMGPQITNSNGTIVCPGGRLYGIAARAVDLDYFDPELLR